MHSIAVSIIGVAVTDVRLSQTSSGVAMSRFRMVSQPRKFDQTVGNFIDLDASYLTVLAWRGTAEHVAASIRRGDPVLVVGRMRVREYSHEGASRLSVEVDAQAVGHDLSRGTSAFTKSMRPLERSTSDRIDAAEEVAVQSQGDRTAA